MQINTYINQDLQKIFKRKKILANILRFIFLISILISLFLKSSDSDTLFGYSSINWLTAIIIINILSMTFIFLNGLCPACKKSRSLFFDSNICQKCKFDFNKSDNQIISDKLGTESITNNFKTIKKQQYIINFFVIPIALLGGFLLVLNTPLFFGMQTSYVIAICFTIFIGLTIYSKINWRCPACKSYLGQSMKITKCPNCNFNYFPE